MAEMDWTMFSPAMLFRIGPVFGESRHSTVALGIIRPALTLSAFFESPILLRLL
jgi:hypothetical protein